MTDFAERRRIMVDTQVRPSDVTKFPIIDALLTIPREVFVPDQLREAAYSDSVVDLGKGRVMLDPRTLAKILDALDILPDELVLDIGCGYGYSSAVIARLAEAVVALEEDEDMLREAQTALIENNADNVVLQEGTLSDGAPEHGPYDVILLEGGVAQLPDHVAAQLKDGGRIACIFMQGALGAVRIGYKSGHGISWRFAFNAGAPVLPGFETQETFSF